MSNIAFKSGDYAQQKFLFSSNNRDGMLFLNPENRTIVIGKENEYVNFNPTMVNDNQQIDGNNNYTNSSEYLLNNKMTKDRTDLFTVSDARIRIGNTNSSMTNGYITNQINTLVNTMMYYYEDNNFDYQIIKTNKYENQDIYEYIYKEYTFKYPTIGRDFNYLLIFAYNTPDVDVTDKHTFVYLYKFENRDDVKIHYIHHNDGSSTSIKEDSTKIPTVYKVYWI